LIGPLNPDFHHNLPLQTKSFELSPHTTFAYNKHNTNTQKPTLNTAGRQYKTSHSDYVSSKLQRQWLLPKNSTSSQATRTSSPKCRPFCPRRPSTCARKPWIWSRSRVLSRRSRGTRRSGLRRRYVCSLSLSPFFVLWSLLFFLSKPRPLYFSDLFSYIDDHFLLTTTNGNNHTLNRRMLTDWNRSRDRFWLRIRACALTLSASCRVLMCTCHALCLSTIPNHSFPSFHFPLLQSGLTRDFAGNGSSKPSASRNSTSCSQASRTRLLRRSALSLTAKVPAMSLLSSREGRRYVCAFRCLLSQSCC
jgi:hypothetical protein